MSASTHERGFETSLLLPVEGASLPGDLSVPDGVQGLVLFAHGSGSSRKSSRNRFVASALRERELGTLLFDLLTAEEAESDAIDASLRFDIPLLARRLAGVTTWVKQLGPVGRGPLGYFGASTWAAAALIAAALLPDDVAAVVSRGGRPDLAGQMLAQVRAPTLLIVGGEDATVLELNQRALELLPGPKRLAIVPGATHLFEEPGALGAVARLAGEWFAQQFASGSVRTSSPPPPAAESSLIQ